MLVSSILFLILNSCISTNFKLQNFEIINKEFDSIVNIVSKNYCSNCNENEKKVIVVDFTLDNNSIPEFWFSFHEKNELRDFYIFHLNRRIIGYVVKNNVDIILLSNVNRKDIFESYFCKFIRPTEITKKINYLYFPNNQYKQSELIKTSDGQKTISRWPDHYGIHDYIYIHFKFINNKIVQGNASDLALPK